jgi:hypothetical protein
MVNLRVEQPIPLEAACRIVPPARGGKKTHLSTLLRWITKGAKGPGGETVRLEAVRLGGRWMTSREALQRFAEALTPAASGATTSLLPRTPRQRRAAAERAGRELERLGI